MKCRIRPRIIELKLSFIVLKIPLMEVKNVVFLFILCHNVLSGVGLHALDGVWSVFSKTHLTYLITP